MQALQVIGPGSVELVELEMPQPGVGEVLVQIEGCTTCPNWDMTLWRGIDIFERASYPRYPLLPGRPGHEMCGTIVAVGPDVKELRAGDRVASIFDSGEARPGFYAQYAIAQETQLLKVPAALALEDCASLELAQCVAVSFQRAGDLSGMRVGISGLGPAGLIAAQMARAAGAVEVIGFELDESRSAIAYALGIDRVLDPRSEAFQALATLPPAQQLDLSIDCVGLAASTQNLLRVTRARVLIFGVPHGSIVFGMAEWAKGAQVEGYGVHNRAAGELALSLILAGKLQLSPLISTRLPLSRYAEGIELLLKRQALKILYTPAS